MTMDEALNKSTTSNGEGILTGKEEKYFKEE